jgi:hypothetical protein
MRPTRTFAASNRRRLKHIQTPSRVSKRIRRMVEDEEPEFRAAVISDAELDRIGSLPILERIRRGSRSSTGRGRRLRLFEPIAASRFRLGLLPEFGRAHVLLLQEDRVTFLPVPSKARLRALQSGPGWLHEIRFDGHAGVKSRGTKLL